MQEIIKPNGQWCFSSGGARFFGRGSGGCPPGQHSMPNEQWCLSRQQASQPGGG
jgi:hypothetical protein